MKNQPLEEEIITAGEVALAVIDRLKTGRDLQISGMTEDLLPIGLDAEPVRALWLITKKAIEGGGRPPGISGFGGLHVSLKGKTLPELVGMLRDMSEQNIILKAWEQTEAEGGDVLAGLTDRLLRALGEKGSSTVWKTHDLEDLKNLTFEEQRWVWEGWIPTGFVTLVSADPKKGKTTLLFHLLPHLLDGTDFLDSSTALSGGVLLISEEPMRQIRERLGDVSYRGVTVVDDPYEHTWPSLMAQTSAAIRDGVSLVIIDTLPNLWPVKDENRPSEVKEALRPIFQMSRSQGATFILTCHDRKESGGGIRSVRGSSGLTGEVDVILKLEGLEGAGANPNRRVLEVTGRPVDMNRPTLIELVDGQYQKRGSPQDIRKDASVARVISYLSRVGVPQTVAQVKQGTNIPQTTLYRILRDAEHNHLVKVEKTEGGKLYSTLAEPVEIGDNNHDPEADAALVASL